MSILESVRAFICTCPFLKDGRIGVDYLGDRPTEYTVDAVPAASVLQWYIDGSSLRQFLFVFASCEQYGDSVRTNLENNGFYEQFANWLEQKTRALELPDLGGGKKALRVEALTGGYLHDGAANTARYQIQCRLTYEAGPGGH